MKDLIEALQIFLKYNDPDNPTCCGHDTLYVMGPPPEEMTPEDVKRLGKLDFTWDKSLGSWYSYRFGSA